MGATFVDVDPSEDFRAVLSEPIGPIAPNIQVEDPQSPYANSDSNLATGNNSKDTEIPVNSAKDYIPKVF